ncbi:3-isopropylmalate dehydratase small subunit [Aliikangiella sp. G2MR2-5]|uniref:3-isopropylmalate dehydratase small subunit n=1 Tax=Aliikangiella sp. G2MR2-5 TaxID=2788943 RepID=UPI0018AA7069|nr:3-isopropylmalate dehydratase small subunit [Aliikangiella sp. G2MR2-5]
MKNDNTINGTSNFATEQSQIFSREPIKKVEGVAAVIDIENIDTDQIIPAEYLKITNKEGLGEHLFSNWRYSGNSNSGRSANPDFVLNKTETKNAEILITGENLGCGSSREHAPWALLDFGIKVVISSSIADIFRNNAVKNGLMPIVIDKAEHQFLLQQNAKVIAVDLVSQKILVDRKIINFEIEPFARYCFLNGMDQLDFLFSQETLISNFESRQAQYI